MNIESTLNLQSQDALSKLIETTPINFNPHHKILTASWLDTKLGAMIAIGDETDLYFLTFMDISGLQNELEKLQFKTKANIILGSTPPIKSITLELASYFDGTLTDFKTPLQFSGSTFQKLVWEELMRIPYGQTQSYISQATAIGKNKAQRAVANANGANPLAIIIPCHRIIHNNGLLGGYRSGVARKQWLIQHEAAHSLTSHSNPIST